MEIILKDGSEISLDKKCGRVTWHNADGELIASRPFFGAEALLIQTIEELYEMYSSWQEDHPSFELDSNGVRGIEPK